MRITIFRLSLIKSILLIFIGLSIQLLLATTNISADSSHLVKSEALVDRILKNAAYEIDSADLRELGFLTPTEIDSEVLPALLNNLSTGDSNTRKNITQALAVLSSRRSTALESLIKLLHDHDLLVKKVAIKSLITEIPKLQKIPPSLITLLEDPSSEIRLIVLANLRALIKEHTVLLESEEGKWSLESPKKWDYILNFSALLPKLEETNKKETYEIVRRYAKSLVNAITYIQELRATRLSTLASLQMSQALPSGPYHLKKVSSACSTSQHTFIAAESTATGRELWKLSREAGKATLVKNIAPGALNGLGEFPRNARCASFAEKIYFSTTNNQLWESDGSGEGTRFVEDFKGDLLLYRFKEILIVIENRKMGSSIWRYDINTNKRNKIISWPYANADIAIDPKGISPYFIIMKTYGSRPAQFVASQGSASSTQELPSNQYDLRFPNSTSTGSEMSTNFLSFIGGKAIFKEISMANQEGLLAYDYQTNVLENISVPSKFSENFIGVSRNFAFLPIVDRSNSLISFLRTNGSRPGTEEVDILKDIGICQDFIDPDRSEIRKDIYDIINLSDQFFISIGCQNGYQEHIVESLLSDGRVENTRRILPPSSPLGGYEAASLGENNFFLAAGDGNGNTSAIYLVKGGKTEKIFNIDIRVDKMGVIPLLGDLTYLEFNGGSTELLLTDGTAKNTKKIMLIGDR